MLSPDNHGIDESVMVHLNSVYPPQQNGTDSIIGDEDKLERMIRGRVFARRIVDAPSKIEHIIQELSYVGFGPGKYLVDLGVGDGRVLEVGYLLGGEVGGPEAIQEHAMVALEKFEKLRKRGVSTPPNHSIKIGADIMNYDISRADVVWAYLMAEKQPEAVKRFYMFGKSDGKLIVYRPSLECYEAVLKSSMRAPFEGSIHDNVMIINKN